jgi:hypothetical protein
MAEVVHTLTSANGRLRVEVVRRPTGGYQLAFSRFRQENVPEYGWVWEGWVSVPGRITLTDTPERGATLAAEELAVWERQDAELGATPDAGRI